MSHGNPGGEVPMSHNEQSQYVRTQEYTSNPQCLYPSTNVAYHTYGMDEDNDTVIVDTRTFNSESHEFAEGDFICPGFFNRVDLGGFTRRFSPPQWTYDMRRQAQSILPFMSLGPSVCLRDADYIRNQGFTLLLAIRSRHSAQARLVSGEKAANEVGIMADTVDVLDNQELISAFPRAIRRINDHLAGMDMSPPVMSTSPQQKRKVLVFCESGNERSAAVAVAYLMVMLNIESVEAIHLVQQRRFCTSIDDSMKYLLTAFESILSAKRDVEIAKQKVVPRGAATLAPPSLPPMLAKKRSFQDHKDDDDLAMEDVMDMDDDDDTFGERKPSAPFQDRMI